MPWSLWLMLTTGLGEACLFVPRENCCCREGSWGVGMGLLLGLVVPLNVALRLGFLGGLDKEMERDLSRGVEVNRCGQLTWNKP